MLYSFFFVRAQIGQKNGGGGQFDPPPGNPRIGQHPGKGGVKVEHVSWMLLMYIGKP